MKVLILTDHSKHSSENSLYELSKKLLAHESVNKIDIASRKTVSNLPFFSCQKVTSIYSTTIDSSFHYDSTNHPLDNNIKQTLISEYDFVWLRLPPPLSKEFLDYLEIAFSGSVIINRPKAIYETGSKAFLMNFEEVCPPMKICDSLDEILDFSRAFPIVIKPFREYGGKGILKINGDQVSNAKESFTLQEFTNSYKKISSKYLAVKYLKNVKKGDKRIIIIDGKIMGATLRLPPKDSWICNVAMGGSSNQTEVTPEEIEIVQKINPLLSSKGIIMYGIDTLLDDNNRRILSEINTTSIGGLPQMANLTNKPVVQIGIDLIVKYVLSRIK